MCRSQLTSRHQQLPRIPSHQFRQSRRRFKKSAGYSIRFGSNWRLASSSPNSLMSFRLGLGPLIEPPPVYAPRMPASVPLVASRTRSRPGGNRSISPTPVRPAPDDPVRLRPGAVAPATCAHQAPAPRRDDHGMLADRRGVPQPCRRPLASAGADRADPVGDGQTCPR
jgi:hypothetical protein